MARRKRRAAKKRKVEWSKVVCLLAMLAGYYIKDKEGDLELD